MQQRSWALIGAGLAVAAGLVLTLRRADPGAEAGLVRSSVVEQHAAGDSPALAAASAEQGEEQPASRLRSAAGQAPGSSSEAATLRGKVESEDGGPCARATIALHPATGGSAQTLTAGGRGTFASGALEPGRYRVVVAAAAHLPLTSELTLDPGGEHELPPLVLRAARSLRGRVVDPAGAGLTGAELLAVSPPDPWKPVTLTLRSLTGASGAFELDRMPRHPLRLGISAPARPPLLVPVPAGTTELEIVVPSGWSLPVRVRDIPGQFAPLRIVARPATGSAPASDEALWRMHARRHWPLGSADHVLVEGLTQGVAFDLELQASRSDGDWTSCAPTVRVAEGDLEAVLGPPTSEPEVLPQAQANPPAENPPTGTIEAIVTDPSGQVVANQAVVLSQPAHNPGQVGQSRQQRTDWLGRARFGDLAPGSYSLRLQRSTPVGRRVMSGGSVAQIALGFDDQASGTPDEPVPCEVRADAVAQVTLLAEVRHALGGIVFVGGLPAAGVSVHVFDSPLDLPHVLAFADLGGPAASTPASGRFRLPPMRSGPATLAFTLAGRPVPHVAPVQVGPGAADLIFHLPAGILTGIVRSSLGDPLAGAEIRVFARDEDGATLQPPKVMVLDASGAISLVEPDQSAGSISTSSDGRYALEGIPPRCTLQLEVRAAGHRMATDSFQTKAGADHELDFVLAAGGALEVRTLDGEGNLLRNVWAELSWHGSGEQEHRRLLAGVGSCTFEDLAPGPWELTVEQFEGERRSTPQQVLIVSGETLAVDARMP